MPENVTILIAEDDVALADLWVTAFSKAGYDVVLAENGQIAIDWLNANTLPDVVIVDYNMPIATGIAVIHELSNMEGADSVTTVMVTANHLVESEAINDQIDMFLQKPVGFREMKTLVARLTQHNRP